MRQKSTPTGRPARTRRGAREPTRLDSMQEWLEEILKPLPELECRSMFGGTGIYSAGTMFAILYAGRVYLKTSEETRAAFVQRGSEPFQPRTGTVLASYHEVPGELLDDETELLEWAQQAVRAARAAPAKSRARAVSPEAILEGYGDEIRALAEKLREVVRDAAPRASEAGYRGWRLIGYRSPHYFCFIAPQRDHVRLGFEHGHRLADPDELLESMGKQVRFVRLVPGKRIPSAALRRLIRAALLVLPERRATSPRRATPAARGGAKKPAD